MELARCNKGLTTEALSPYLVPLKAGDPLGLGRDRPPAPADPDKYDRAREDKEYARSLLKDDERQKLDEEIDQVGYMQIHMVREMLAQHSVKGSLETGAIDPEMLAVLDARIDYKVFVAGDSVYLRQELYDAYSFHEMNVQPEAVFCQQELGVFPSRKYSMNGELEYVARDVGDESVEFVMIEDLVGKATRPGYELKRSPLRVVKTKVYVGKQAWEDFQLVERFFRGATRIAAAQIAYKENGTAPSSGGLFAMFMPKAPQLTDAAEHQRREEELARREEEARQREKAAEELQKRLEADIRRLEDMLATTAQARNTQARGDAQARGDTAKGPDCDTEDSVAL